jgi:hypothetical protein
MSPEAARDVVEHPRVASQVCFQALVAVERHRRVGPQVLQFRERRTAEIFSASRSPAQGVLTFAGANASLCGRDKGASGSAGRVEPTFNDSHRSTSCRLSADHGQLARGCHA